MESKDISYDDCFARQKLLLKLFGLSANQNCFYKIYSVSFLTISTIYVFSVIPEILKIENDFDELTYSLFFETSQVTAILSTHCLYWKRYELQKLFAKIETLRDLSNCTSDKKDKVFIERCENSIKNQSYIASMLLAAIVVSQVSISLLLSINREEWLLPFGSGPDMNNNYKFVIQIIMFTLLQSFIVVELFTYVNMLTFISGHFKQLQKYLIIITTITNKDESSIKKIKDNNIANGKINNYNEIKIVDWETLKVKVGKIVSYHVGIIGVADQIESVFSLFILIIFGGAIMGLCLLIYHGTSVNVGSLSSIKDFTLIILGYLLLILVSIWGEQIITESDNVSKICYDVDFIGADLRFQKSLLLIMTRAQKPVTPTIGKLKVLNLTTMMSVFQTIYSYYAFLRNMNQ